MGTSRKRTAAPAKVGEGRAERSGLWLFKEELQVYSFANLQREGETTWDGVTNNLARKHLRQVQHGDRVFCDHTGQQRAIVGEMLVVSDPGPDPQGTDPAAVVLRSARYASCFILSP